MREDRIDSIVFSDSYRRGEERAGGRERSGDGGEVGARGEESFFFYD